MTPDLTLFSKEDIQNTEHAELNPTEQAAALKLPLKVRAVRVGLRGEWFGSLKEGRRWIELRQLEKSGHIARLERQRRWPLHALIPRTDLSGNFGARDTLEMITTHYVSDFSYDVLTPEKTIFTVEDCKGVRTDDYIRKSKHFAAQYGITITET